LSVDLLRVPRFEGLRVETFVVNERTRTSIVDALAWSKGDLVAIARILLLRAEPDHEHADPLPPIPEPTIDLARSVEIMSEGEGPLGGGFEVRIGNLPDTSRTLLWLRMRCPVVAGDPSRGFSRAAVAADWANAVCNGVGDGLEWINADANLAFGREPIGDWLAVVPRQRIVSGGRSTSTCALFDANGSFASASVSSIEAKRRAMSVT
jgi:hypothetical protein